MALFEPFKLRNTPKGRASFRDKGKMAHRAQVICQDYIISLAAPYFPVPLPSAVRPSTLYVKLF